MGNIINLKELVSLFDDEKELDVLINKLAKVYINNKNKNYINISKEHFETMYKKYNYVYLQKIFFNKNGNIIKVQVKDLYTCKEIYDKASNFNIELFTKILIINTLENKLK